MLLPIALVLWGISLVIAPGEPRLLTIRLESQVTSERLAAASVQVGETRYVADQRGEIIIEPVSPGTMVSVSADGHESMQREVPEPGDGELTLSLSGVLVIGKLVDAISDQPVEGAEVTVAGTDGERVAASHTDEFGNFIFKLIPEDAALTIRDDVYGESTWPIGSDRELRIALDPPPVTGRVVNENGLPLEGIEVRGPAATAVTERGGQFTLVGVGQGEEVVFESSDDQVTIIAEGQDLGVVTLQADDIVTTPPEGGEG